MDRIDKYKRVEEDQHQRKGKAKLIPQEMRDFAGQAGPANAQAVNILFREPVHQVLEKIKNESFFKWPKKMRGDPMRRN